MKKTNAGRLKKDKILVLGKKTEKIQKRNLQTHKM